MAPLTSSMNLCGAIRGFYEIEMGFYEIEVGFYEIDECAYGCVIGGADAPAAPSSIDS